MAQIIIDEKIVTSINVKGGDLISGRLVDNNFGSLNIIDGDIVEFYQTEFDFATGFNFNIQLSNGTGTHTIQFKWYTMDGAEEITELQVVFEGSTAYLYIGEEGQTDATVTVTADAATKSIALISSGLVEVGFQSTKDWVIPTASAIRLNYRVLKNTTVEGRTALVTVTGKDSSNNVYTVTLNVVQQANMDVNPSSFIITGQKNYNIDAGVEGSALVLQTSIREENIASVEVQCDSDWVTADYVNGQFEEEGEIALAAFLTTYIDISVEWNSEVYSRVATIAVKATGSDGKVYNDVIYINQEGNKYVSKIETDGYEFNIGNKKDSKLDIKYFTYNVYDETVKLKYPSFYNNWLLIELDKESKYINIKTLTDNTSQPEGIEFVIDIEGISSVDSSKVYGQVIVTQLPPTEYREFPIWKDVELIIPRQQSDDLYVSYRLIIEGTDEVIYNGNAYLKNGSAQVRVNDIVKNYIDEKYDINGAQWQDNNAYANILFQVEEDGEYQDYMVLRAYNDWSYDTDRTSVFASDPISKVLDYRQHFVFTIHNRFDSFESKIQTDLSDGDGFYKVINNQMVTETIRDLHNLDSVYLIDLVSREEIEFEVKCTKNKYCLYYKNLYGGFDSILLNRTSKKLLTTKSDEYITNELNISGKHQKKQYERTVQRKWQLHTNLMNDAQSDKIRHIALTNCAWLQNLETGETVPVNVTDSTTQVKTFINNGRKVINYEITIEEALNKYSR